MKRINNKPFLDLSEYIDLKSFDQLQPKIWKGLAMNMLLNQKNLNKNIRKRVLKNTELKTYLNLQKLKKKRLILL